MLKLRSHFIYEFYQLHFFFQAEDGIRDRNVTGVRRVLFRSISTVKRSASVKTSSLPPCSSVKLLAMARPRPLPRSEERRVGKEYRFRVQLHTETKKKEKKKSQT